MLEIRFAGLEILGHPRDMTRPFGAFVSRGGFQGWEGLPAGRREALARAVQHGEHDVPVYLPSRVVTIDGYLLAGTEHDLRQLSRRLSGAGATGERLVLSVELQGETLYAFGRRLLCVPEDSGIRSGRVFRSSFQLQVQCADPRQYGDTAILPGDRLVPRSPDATATSINVAHYGNFPAFPVVVIPSAPAAYTVSAGGKTFTVSGAAAGGTHEVHLRTGRVFRDGVEMPGVGRGPLWSVPAGVQLVHTLSVPGRVRIADTFV